MVEQLSEIISSHENKKGVSRYKRLRPNLIYRNSIIYNFQPTLEHDMIINDLKRMAYTIRRVKLYRKSTPANRYTIKNHTITIGSKCGYILSSKSLYRYRVVLAGNKGLKRTPQELVRLIEKSEFYLNAMKVRPTLGTKRLFFSYISKILLLTKKIQNQGWQTE